MCICVLFLNPNKMNEVNSKKWKDEWNKDSVGIKKMLYWISPTRCDPFPRTKPSQEIQFMFRGAWRPIDFLEGFASSCTFNVVCFNKQNKEVLQKKMHKTRWQKLKCWNKKISRNWMNRPIENWSAICQRIGEFFLVPTLNKFQTKKC